MDHTLCYTVVLSIDSLPDAWTPAGQHLSGYRLNYRLGEGWIEIREGLHSYMISGQK